jgi:hypothetical protein
MINLPNIIFSFVMGFLMSSSITLATTLIHVRPTSNFFLAWLEVWSVAYPVAIICILVYRPLASKITALLLEKMKPFQ